MTVRGRRLTRIGRAPIRAAAITGMALTLAASAGQAIASQDDRSEGDGVPLRPSAELQAELAGTGLTAAARMDDAPSERPRAIVRIVEPSSAPTTDQTGTLAAPSPAVPSPIKRQAFPTLAEGTRLGLLQVLVPLRDARGQTIDVGHYELRYAVQPMFKEHLPTPWNRDFALLRRVGGTVDAARSGAAAVGAIENNGTDVHEEPNGPGELGELGHPLLLALMPVDEFTSSTAATGGSTSDMPMNLAALLHIGGVDLVLLVASPGQ